MIFIKNHELENENIHHECAKKSGKQDKEGIERQIEIIRIEYENKIANHFQEIEVLNAILKMKANEIEEWKCKYNSIEIRSGQSSMKVKFIEYENKIALLSQEIERLSYSLKMKNERYDKLSVYIFLF